MSSTAAMYWAYVPNPSRPAAAVKATTLTIDQSRAGINVVPRKRGKPYAKPDRTANPSKPTSRDDGAKNEANMPV